MDAETRHNFTEACHLKYELNRIYPTNYISECINHLCSNQQLDPMGFGLMLPNLASVLCNNSTVLRDNQFRSAINIFSVLVACPTYGKSSLFSIFRKAINFVKKIRPKKFYNESTKMTFVIVDEFSDAGILNHLDRSTKWLLFDEADDQFDNIGLIKQQKGKKSKSANPFDCRSLMMQLWNGPDDYTKVLSAELQQLESARVILTGASTGEMIQTVNSPRRPKTETENKVDPMIERIMFFALASELRLTSERTKLFNFSTYPSLEQLALVLSFLENVVLMFDDDANKRVNEYGDELFKQANFTLNQHLQCRLTKPHSQILRYINSITLIECAFDVLKLYREANLTFDMRATANEQFMKSVERLIKENYGKKINNSTITSVTTITTSTHLNPQKNDCLIVNLAIVESATYLIEMNLKQYTTLFNCESRSSAPLQSTVTTTQLVSSSTSLTPAIGDNTLQQVYRAILQFSSIAFTKTNLYENSFLKRNNKLIGLALAHLADIEKLLLHYSSGGFNGFTSVKIYVKMLAIRETAAEIIDYDTKLNKYGLDYDRFKKSCSMLTFFRDNNKMKLKLDAYRQITSSVYATVLQQDTLEFLYTPPDLTEPKSKLTTNNDHDDQSVLLATVRTQPDPRLQSQTTTLLLLAAPQSTVIPRQQPDTLLISQPPNAATDGTMLQDAPTDEDDFIDSSVLPLTALNGKQSFNVSMTGLSKDDETWCMSIESKDGKTESNVNDHTMQGLSTILSNVATHVSQDDGISSRTRHKQYRRK
ncbi:unnamed protein product [Didymodactylos carnosus]|uniref:Uncharacterized protein n=1 Tax=Didymodactylos carnosus TaxID=1234261 RepID=A0A8S2DGP9_9BILA|nr:unnamed protein product [Didymodactylos carnosus]CAF3701011.1 unnamed protein product [Didymodactylos carnosus]